MTNEEALKRIRELGTPTCFVKWSLTSHEIVAVRAGEFGWFGTGVADTVSPDEGPHMGRFLDVANVTLETLRTQQEKNQQEAAELAERVRRRLAWQDVPIEQLLDLLEAERVSQKFADFEVPFILKTLYYARSAALSSDHLGRLNAMAARRFFSPLGSKNAYTLECYLAVIGRDPSRLLRHWDRQRPSDRKGFREGVVTAAGDLQIDRHDVLEYLVERVARGAFFDARFAAMIALGKIGAGAGESAAEAILIHIYESSELVASVRRLAVARIRSSAEDWVRCGNCVRGGRLDTSDGSPWFELCSDCSGLGHIPRPTVLA